MELLESIIANFASNTEEAADLYLMPADIRSAIIILMEFLTLLKSYLSDLVN